MALPSMQLKVHSGRGQGISAHLWDHLSPFPSRTHLSHHLLLSQGKKKVEILLEALSTNDLQSTFSHLGPRTTSPRIPNRKRCPMYQLLMHYLLSSWSQVSGSQCEEMFHTSSNASFPSRDPRKSSQLPDSLGRGRSS